MASYDVARTIHQSLCLGVEGFTGGELLFEGVRDSPSEKGNESVGAGKEVSDTLKNVNEEEDAERGGNESVGAGRERFHMAHSPGVG